MLRRHFWFIYITFIHFTASLFPPSLPVSLTGLTGNSLTSFPDSLVYDAVWSPDGAQLAFTAGDAVWLVKPGQSPAQLTQTTTARHPAWLVGNN